MKNDTQNWHSSKRLAYIQSLCRSSKLSCKTAQENLSCIALPEESRATHVAAVANLLDAEMKIRTALDRLDRLAQPETPKK